MPTHAPADAPAMPFRSDARLLCALASTLLLVHFLLGNRYGFHRDELQVLDDARHLQFGFVAYPPLTALAGRVSIAIFGISVGAFRLPAAIVNAVSLVIIGLTARELGGRRPAQVLALALALPIPLAFSTVLQYNTFDYLAWALTALFTARLLRTGDGRWWLAVGAAIGLGALSKYSIALLALSLTGAFAFLPGARHHLRSRWFWLGALAMVLVASPNLIWLATHHFVTLQMEHSIHLRDVRIGRTDGYFTDQLRFTMLSLPLVIVGLAALLRSATFRPLASFFLGPFVLFALLRGRGYYLLPAYIPLYAAGAVALESWLTPRSHALRVALRSLVAVALLADTAVIGAMFLPIAEPGSRFFRWQMKSNDDMIEELGWPEFVAQVAAAWNGLPPEQRARAAILSDNYGEAAAIALYGPAHRLPTPISEVNSFHDRGFGPYPPETVLVTGADLDDVTPHFQSCRIVAEVHWPYDLRGIEQRYGRHLILCEHPRFQWSTMWPGRQHFG